MGKEGYQDLLISGRESVCCSFSFRSLTGGLLFSVPFLSLFSDLAYFVNAKWARITVPKTWGPPNDWLHVLPPGYFSLPQTISSLWCQSHRVLSERRNHRSFLLDSRSMQTLLSECWD